MAINMWGGAGQKYQTRGAVYTADAGGFIANVANNDVMDMLDSGCTISSVGGVLGRLLGANMNVTTDQPINLQVPAGARYGITKIWGANATVNLTTAAGGIYTAAAKGGPVIVLAAQAYTGFSAATVFAGLTVVSAQLALTQTANPLYFNLTTAQGAAATMDLFVFGDVLG